MSEPQALNDQEWADLLSPTRRGATGTMSRAGRT